MGDDTQSVIITGIAGSLARLAAMELVKLGHDVAGVDYRRKPADFPRSIPYYRASYNKTGIADAFSKHKPTAVLHLGRVGNLAVGSTRRFDLNVRGSTKVKDLCLKYKVKRLVILSTFHIYGAHPHNHIPIYEDEPLRALQTIPKISDVVQLDYQALTWVYRHRKLRTCILRPVSVIGPHVNNTISRYLRVQRPAYVMGFNPMWQFLHESDMLRALLAAFNGRGVGSFNISGRGSIPFVEALEIGGATPVPVPHQLFDLYTRLRSDVGPLVPQYMVDFMKYPTIISDASFRKEFDWEPQVPIPDAIRSCVRRMPVDSVLS